VTPRSLNLHLSALRRNRPSSFSEQKINLKPKTYFMYRQFLTFRNSVFCPDSAFMCFVRISKQTAIISLYNIHLSVFITEAEFVYCAVRTGSLNQADTASSLNG